MLLQCRAEGNQLPDLGLAKLRRRRRYRGAAGFFKENFEGAFPLGEFDPRLGKALSRR
jgi:hypothetical protein